MRFPQGLPIGTVTGRATDEGSLEQQLDVQMLADLSDLTFVSVVLWEPPRVKSDGARSPSVLFSAAVLQRGLFSQLRIAGVSVDVFLLLAIAGGMMLGPERGAIFGFFAGLTLDLLVQTPLGLSALVYCLVGFGTGRLQGTVLRANRVWPLALVARRQRGCGRAVRGRGGSVGPGQRHFCTTPDDHARGRRRQRRSLSACP